MPDCERQLICCTAYKASAWTFKFSCAESIRLPGCGEVLFSCWACNRGSEGHSRNLWCISTFSGEGSSNCTGSGAQRQLIRWWLQLWWRMPGNTPEVDITVLVHIAKSSEFNCFEALSKPEESSQDEAMHSIWTLHEKRLDFGMSADEISKLEVTVSAFQNDMQNLEWDYGKWESSTVIL